MNTLHIFALYIIRTLYIMKLGPLEFVITVFYGSVEIILGVAGGRYYTHIFIS